MEDFLTVKDLVKIFPINNDKDTLTVFRNINFEVKKGEFVSIIGHSGCGKSTVLNSLAGLDSPSGGTINMLGKPVVGPSLDRGVIFQNHSLLPWLSAMKNITMAISCRFKDMPKDKIEERANHFLDMVGLQDAKDKKPSELSGGMKQRVGIARAFSIEPSLLLMDEPFGALDALTRGKLQDQLVEICSRTQQTTFMITHDIDEAILLSDKILLMSNGPEARVAECILVDIPKPRSRATIVKHPLYYDVRNYLVEFLVERSETIRQQLESGDLSDKNFPVVVNLAKKKPTDNKLKTVNI